MVTIRLRSGLQPLYTTLMTAGVVIVVWKDGGQVVDGTMTVGTLVAFLALYQRFVNRGFRVPQLNIRAEIPEGSAARVRVVPEQAGHFFFACDVFCGSGHEEMEGDIIVTEP